MVPTWPLYPEQYNIIINQSKLTPPNAIYLDICTFITFGVLKRRNNLVRTLDCRLLSAVVFASTVVV